MSDYHILTTSRVMKTYDNTSVVFHITVPNENNLANINLRTIMVDATEVSNESVIVNHSTDFSAEANAMLSGEIYEHSETVEFDKDLSDLEKRDIIDDRFIILSNSISDVIRNRYARWGYNRDIS